MRYSPCKRLDLIDGNRDRVWLACRPFAVTQGNDQQLAHAITAFTPVDGFRPVWDYSKHLFSETKSESLIKNRFAGT
jgi:hypothetical protein